MSFQLVIKVFEMKKMTKYEAAVFLRMSPYLIKWFTKYAPKQGDPRKLSCERGKDNELYFEEDCLKKFDRYLSEPWPHETSRGPPIPQGIEREIKRESSYRCVICANVSGQLAHIDPVHNSFNNHPHNLIYLCPNCHDFYDKKKLLKKADIITIKQDLLETRVSIWRSTRRSVEYDLILDS